jgi:hypothetical protein
VLSCNLVTSRPLSTDLHWKLQNHNKSLVLTKLLPVRPLNLWPLLTIKWKVKSWLLLQDMIWNQLDKPSTLSWMLLELR